MKTEQRLVRVIKVMKIGNAWLCQACIRQNPTLNGPQGDYHVGLHRILGDAWGPACFSTHQAPPRSGAGDSASQAVWDGFAGACGCLSDTAWAQRTYNTEQDCVTHASMCSPEKYLVSKQHVTRRCAGEEGGGVTKAHNKQQPSAFAMCMVDKKVCAVLVLLVVHNGRHRQIGHGINSLLQQVGRQSTENHTDGITAAAFALQCRRPWPASAELGQPGARRG